MSTTPPTTTRGSIPVIITECAHKHIQSLALRADKLLPSPSTSNSSKLSYAQRLHDRSITLLKRSDNDIAYTVLLAFLTIIFKEIKPKKLSLQESVQYDSLKTHAVKALAQTELLKKSITETVSLKLLDQHQQTLRFPSPPASSSFKSADVLAPPLISKLPSVHPSPQPSLTAIDADVAALDAALNGAYLPPVRRSSISVDTLIRRPLSNKQRPSHTISPVLVSPPRDNPVSPSRFYATQPPKPTGDPVKKSRRMQTIMDPAYWDLDDTSGSAGLLPKDIYGNSSSINLPPPSYAVVPHPDTPVRSSSLQSKRPPPALPPRQSPYRRNLPALPAMSIMSPRPNPLSPAMAPSQVDYRFHDSDSSMSSLVGAGVAGLKNLGNSCYQNSILQCLFGTVPMIRFFLSGDFKGHINKVNPIGSKGKVSVAFFMLMQDMKRNASASVAPVQFREMLAEEAPYFATREQQDSQEFLTYLLDALHEDLKTVVPAGTKMPPDDNDDLLSIGDMSTAASIAWERYMVRNTSFIANFFMGQLRSVIQCMVCGTRSVTYAPFSSLSVPIVGSHLTDGLAELLRPEILDGDNAWKCPTCNVASAAQQSMDITRLAPVLIIHMKRFSYSGPFRNKIDTLVHYPLRKLDLSGIANIASHSKVLGRAPLYDLYAVSNHYGGLDGGHYTAGVRHGSGWHYFDDSRVSKCTEDKIVTNAAYTLFYRQSEDLNYRL